MNRLLASRGEWLSETRRRRGREAALPPGRPETRPEGFSARGEPQVQCLARYGPKQENASEWGGLLISGKISMALAHRPVTGKNLVSGRERTDAPRSGGFLLRAAVVSLLLAWGLGLPALGQEVINREHKVKAAYLYNLGRYITWPEKSFAGREAPFVIGLIEPALVTEDLQKIAEVKTIDGRPIVVRVFTRPEDIRYCHILFLPQGVEPTLQREIVRKFSGNHTLLVGESEEFLDYGGVIAFVVRENTVRLVIALEAAQRESLQISAKLLQIAHTTN